MKKSIRNAVASAAAILCVQAQTFTASAQAGTFKSATDILNTATQEIGNTANSLLNLISILVGVVAIVMLVWNYIKKSKGDGGSNDALAGWGFSLIFVAIALQVVKAVFF